MSTSGLTLRCNVIMMTSRALTLSVRALGGSIVALALATACTPAAPPASTTPPAPPTTAAVTAASPAASVAPSAAAKPSPSPAPSPAASPAAVVKPAASPSANPAVAVALASPSAVARTANNGLLGAWQWQSTQSAGGPAVVAADPTRYTVTFLPAGVLQIRADCNQVGGTYTTSGSDLTIKLGPSTLVGCPPDSQADAFLASLQQVMSFTATGTNLELGLERGGRMLFAVLPPPSLVGPTWQLTGYNNGRGAVQSVLIGTQPTATFGADGQVTGSAGCNQYFGPFQTTGTALTIGPLGSTRMACDQPIMEQETAYLEALQRATTYGFDNGRLVLSDASGATQATFIQ